MCSYCKRLCSHHTSFPVSTYFCYKSDIDAHGTVRSAPRVNWAVQLVNNGLVFEPRSVFRNEQAWWDSVWLWQIVSEFWHPPRQNGTVLSHWPSKARLLKSQSVNGHSQSFTARRLLPYLDKNLLTKRIISVCCSHTCVDMHSFTPEIRLVFPNKMKCLEHWVPFIQFVESERRRHKVQTFRLLFSSANVKYYKLWTIDSEEYSGLS